nr:hypothetical protein [Tanacetum cinerariifolium]
MNAKLVWLLKKYNYRSQIQIGGSSSPTHEICDLYLIEKELHQLHLDEEALRETLEEAAMDEKAREEKMRQNQADDEEFFLEFRVVRYDSDYDSTRVEPSPLTPNPVRIIPGPAGIVQQAKLLKEKVFILDSDRALMSTQEYMQKVVEDVGEDDDFKSGAWISATNYVNATGGHYMVRQKAILDLALQFDNAGTAKEDLRKAYEKCGKNRKTNECQVSLATEKIQLLLTNPNSSTRVEPSPLTPNPVRIIPGPAGIVQQAKLLKENVFILDSDRALMSTQEYMQKVVEDVGEDDDFKSGAWISATNYVNATGGHYNWVFGGHQQLFEKRKT